MTYAQVRIVAWPRPQSSVQMTGNRPSFVGVMWSVGWMPGTVSCFWPHSGTQNEWITSFAVNVSRMSRPSGTRSVPVVRFFDSGYENDQANCCAVTLIRSTFLPRASSRASTIALNTPIAVTSTVGMIVQAISRPV